MGVCVMHAFINLIHRFRDDERGVFAIMFGLMAIVLIAMGGAVVDYVSLEQTRTRAQVALDAAALALQHEIFLVPLNKQDIWNKAEALLEQRINDPRVEAVIENVDIDVAEGSLLLQAHVEMSTIFVSLVGVQTMGARLFSEATRKKLQLEIAMVLDNSGSMLEYRRMTYLKEAAACATNIIFYGTVDEDDCEPVSGAEASKDVKMGVIPFTMYVNVGASNAGAAWIDKQGRSPIANDNFDDDDDERTTFNGPVNRLALYDAITNDNWRGCVEARPHAKTDEETEFYDTDDTTPTSSDPSSLFVPLFAPDLAKSTVPSGSYNNYGEDAPASCNRKSTPGHSVSCTWKEVKTQCSSASDCDGSTTNTFSFTGPAPYPQSCNCKPKWTSDKTTSTGKNDNKIYTRIRVCADNYEPVYSPQLSERELQERLCKYSGKLDDISGDRGPNADCPSEPILPLTNDPDDVQDTIDDMVANGGTNIHEGTAWGFRALSPTEPFTQGDSYDEATSKIMIVMTDGENTAYKTTPKNGTSERRLIDLNGSVQFSAYGYPWNERLGGMRSTNGDLVEEMNNRTLQACTNAKAAGITVYTIGLSTDGVSQSSPEVVRAMLTACASSPDRAYFPDEPQDLRDVFADIAGQLAALRLAQ